MRHFLLNHAATGIQITKYWYIAVMVVISILYVYRLNYNAPFSDEAIYIVLGKMGLFQWDWSSFTAGNWMAGSLFAYPPLTALAYTSFGIVGCRLLNVIFGLMAIYLIGAIAAQLVPPKIAPVTKLVTVIIFGFSALSLLVSRLATYDMPAFYFFFLSLYALLKAGHRRYRFSNWYFLSSISLVIAVLFKIVVVIYAPFLVLYAVYQTVKGPRLKHRFYFIRYYFIPLLVMGLFYLFTQLPNLIIYTATHKNAESVPYHEIITGVAPYINTIIPLFIVGTILLVAAGKYKQWLIFTFLSLWIIVFHLLTHRLSTFDKHLYFSYAFIALIAGIGLGYVALIPRKITRIAIAIGAVVIIFPTLIYSSQLGYRYGQTWANTSQANRYLQSVVRQGDYLLSEEGPTTMLALYNQNHPSLIATFDWYSYQGQEGLNAYSRAVKDGQFDYIVLYQDIGQVNELHHQVQEVVEASKDDTYQLAYTDNTFAIYQRQY